MGVGSSSDADQDDVLDVVGREHGFRVHRVELNSPGQAAGLQSIVDYIVVANGVRLDKDDGSFVRMISESKNVPMRLSILSVPRHLHIPVPLVPSVRERATLAT